MARDPNNPNKFPLQKDPVTGHLTRQDCPDTKGNPCDPDPEMLCTVTGASGTINWVGETWVLPGDSGVEKSVCPTTHTIGRGFRNAGVGSYPNYYANHGWRFGDSLVLERSYNVLNFGTWYRAQTNYEANKNFIRVDPSAAVIDQQNNFNYSGGALPIPPTFFSTPDNSLGVLGPSYAAPYYANYVIPDGFFASYTTGGITYTWARGAGWP